MLIIQFDFDFLSRAEQANIYTIQSERGENIHACAVSNSVAVSAGQ